MRLAAAAASLSLLYLASAEPQGPAQLVGTWRVVRFCERGSTGNFEDPLGPNPIGYFVYTSTGQLSIQVMRTPPAGPLTGTPVQLRSGGTFPNYIGTDQLRTYHIRGDTLSIGAPPFPCRVLIRVR